MIVGLSRAQSPLDYLLGIPAIPANAAMGWLKNKGRPSPRPVSMTDAIRSYGVAPEQLETSSNGGLQLWERSARRRRSGTTPPHPRRT